MQIGGVEFSEGLYYDKLHNWARVEDNVVIQGLTDFGQKIAQEIVFVEVPRSGRDVTQGQTFMSMDSGKWVGRVAAVVGGRIVEVNEELEWEPNLVNESPYEAGWMVKFDASDLSELENLMPADSPEFKAFIDEEAEKYKDVLT